MVSKYKLHIGSYGWQYDNWDTIFYPEDLPTEWQFGYYANEYSVIMIPWNVLHNNFELLQQNVEDSDEQCRLIFEIPVNKLSSSSNDEILTFVQEVLAKIALFGSRGLGIVFNFQYDEVCNLLDEKLKLIKQILKYSQTNINVCINLQAINTEDASLSNSLPKQFLVILNELGIALCRYNESTINLSEPCSSELYITFCDAAKADPKQMRKIVENSLLGECETSTNVLIFRSAIPNHALMETASVISDLL